jgi:hypothetical protein
MPTPRILKSLDSIQEEPAIQALQLMELIPSVIHNILASTDFEERVQRREQYLARRDRGAGQTLPLVGSHPAKIHVAEQLKRKKKRKDKKLSKEAKAKVVSVEGGSFVQTTLRRNHRFPCLQIPVQKAVDRSGDSLTEDESSSEESEWTIYSLNGQEQESTLEQQLYFL